MIPDMVSYVAALDDRGNEISRANLIDGKACLVTERMVLAKRLVVRNEYDETMISKIIDVIWRPDTFIDFSLSFEINP